MEWRGENIGIGEGEGQENRCNFNYLKGHYRESQRKNE
jgi:hypothetical protein